MDKSMLTLTFSQEHLEIIYKALLDVPAKYSHSVLLEIENQVRGIQQQEAERMREEEEKEK